MDNFHLYRFFLNIKIMKKYIGTKEVSATPAWQVDGMVYLKDEAVPQGINKEVRIED